jgi:hypothetical protein
MSIVKFSQFRSNSCQTDCVIDPEPEAQCYADGFHIGWSKRLFAPYAREVASAF